MDLSIGGLRKSFGPVQALAGVDLAVEAGEFFVVLGPSGAGKTTLLRLIAGIDRPDQGRILLDGLDLAQIPMRQRDTAMVFQTFALYPHLTTFENLAYPLREARLPGSEVRARVRLVAEMLRLTHTLDRKPATLSGGEQQRCAIGRALVRRPRLLLLDEPLTNLDAKLRHDTRAEFKRLHRELGGTTIVYATPDQLEALSMGQRIGVLDHGRIVQIATPQRLYGEPANAFVARLVGDPPINLLRGKLVIRDARRAIELPFVELDGDAWSAALGAMPPGTPVDVGLRPQAIVPRRYGERGPQFAARVFLPEPLGDVTIVNLVAGVDQRLKIVLPQEDTVGLRPDDAMTCEIDLAEVCLFAADSGTAIRRNGSEAL
jgi:multiple sugar transport system ATP-binding protein